jgi:lipopolysaccharide transport system ATP-binding protein
MSEVVIRVENLGKRYRIGERERYLALRDVLTRAMSAPARLFGSRKPTSSNGDYSHIWALKNVSFDIRQGEVVGIIGRNGAGKTTLLKILARVTKPTQGFAEVRGRMGTLLEVGTGFHPELTGRENVFLSGAILGMSKAEIRRKFDEIVAFAEVEKFIDTPLKHYSSGMQMRLAFAVAAHLEPEILLVDEVLAVGDVEFQKKCLGKMGDVAKEGRTILFVSHQLNQIRRLCDSCCWVDQGSVRMLGRTAEAINGYERSLNTQVSGTTTTVRPVNRAARFLSWRIQEPESSLENSLFSPGPVLFRFTLQIDKEIRKGELGIVLRNAEGQIVWALVRSNLKLCEGQGRCEIAMPYLPLIPGPYYWEVFINDGHQWINEGQCLPELSVNTPALMHPNDHFKGFLNIPYEFQVHSS